MYLLFPGRHQLLTRFQFEYLRSIIDASAIRTDVHGRLLGSEDSIEAVIFAVTSSNHSNTRRNPLPFYLRAIQLEAFGQELSVPCFIYGIDDVGDLPDFASYTLKKIHHDSERRFRLTPENTWVLCSTPVLRLYEQLGFRVLPSELLSADTWTYRAALPWEVVERIASSENGAGESSIQELMHPASWRVWRNYHLGDKVRLLFRDAMIGADGDLTASRDYNVYVRQMDEIAELKYREVAPFVQPGRIGDIGCAVGSWIRLAGADERFRESDIYGVEVSRHLFEICQQRKLNGEFTNPFVFFSQRNAVSGLAFEPNSMNTIHTSSLTHEIESYGSRADLLRFIAHRFEELAQGGVWINRDVVGPSEKEREVFLWLDDSDGDNDALPSPELDRKRLKAELERLSTRARFYVFVHDFRKANGYNVAFEESRMDDQHLLKLRLRDAMEFLSRKDYTDNWRSEMQETFCFWDFEEWTSALTAVGFRVHPDSRAYTNEWIVQNRWKDKAALFTLEKGSLQPFAFPQTNMLLIGIKS